MTDIQRQIVSAKFRLVAACMKIAASAMEQNDGPAVAREVAESKLHLNDAIVVMELALEGGR